MTTIVQAQPHHHAAIRRLWYQVYCEERGIRSAHADPERRELADPLLERARAFIAVDGDEVTGSVLGTYAGEGTLGSYEAFYELERFPAERRRFGIVTKLMTTRGARRSGIALQLIKAVLSRGLADGIEYAIYDANPPQDTLYRRMGAVDWLGLKHHPEFGEVRVMVSRLQQVRPYATRPLRHERAACV